MVAVIAAPDEAGVETVTFTAPLTQGFGYGIIIGLGFAFALVMIFITWSLKRYQHEIITSEMFSTAGRSVKSGLVASAVVSSWTWAATLLQSSAVAYQYGTSGPFFYASGATVQIILFATLAIELKRRAPNAHTFLEAIRARYGTVVHLVFIVFCLMTNILVTAMLLTGGAAVLNSMTGVPVVAACFLLPIGVVLYTLFGGIKATFITDYMHTVVIVVIIFIFAFSAYASNDRLGSPGKVYDLLVQAALRNPVSGNAEGSYLTMRSKDGGIFWVINLVGNFGTVFLDNGYYNKAIAAHPVHAFPGYVIGGLCWFAIPWLCATTMGLSALALEGTRRIASVDVTAGLVLPFASVELLGYSGAVCTTLMIFMAVTSAFSAQLIAVSSILTYDIYQAYINPAAKGKRLVWVSHLSCVVFAIAMAAFATGLHYAGIGMGYLYLLMGAAAASRAMAMSRSADRSSTLSEGSYHRIGGPHSMAVPPRRYKRSSYSPGCSSTGDDPPVRHKASSPITSSETDQPWSAALPSISEFGAVEDRIASLPSSYRRLRKSRSMFSTRQRSSHIPYGLASPEPYSPTITTSRGQTSDPPRLYRTLRRSMSFLRGDNPPRNTLRHTRSQDVSVQLARSQYQQDLMSSPDSTAWGPLTMAKVRREHKPFRKTCRGTSALDGTSVAEAPLEALKGPQSLGKARAFSTTIKKGIKRVLGLSRNVSEQGKVHASPSSSRQFAESPSTAVDNENDCRDGCAAMNEHIHESAEIRQPTIRRMQSSASLATSRSRVTSWADSTAANTIATPRTSAQQRLSIVSEQEKLVRPDVPPVTTDSIASNAVDSHRLFSALMKRIGGTNAQASEDKIVIGQVKEHRVIPTQGSLTSHHSKRTIRQVSSEISVNSPRSFATANGGPITPYEQPQVHGASCAHSAGLTTKAYQESNKTAEGDISRAESASSVYSRSTSGLSPKLKAARDSPDSAEEPGVATIYASERTAYSSPNKYADSSEYVPELPATDWQNWMDSQMARIENATPTRHYRENAEIHGDDTPNFTSSIPTRKIRVESRGAGIASEDHGGLSRKVSTSSNFSRPFSRTSSLRTVVKARSPSSNMPTPSVPPLLADDVFQDSGGQDRFLKSARTGQSNVGVSPMLSRSSNQPRMVESPTPKGSATEVSPKMNNARSAQYLTKWSPGTYDAKQFHRRSARFMRENRRATNENARLEQGVYDQASGLQSPMSSKRMVEIFLNSRRRQMGIDSDEGTSEPAFL